MCGGFWIEIFLDLSMIFNFEKLEVWQLSKKLSILIYEHTLEFPEDEKFGLKSQLRRASISVSSNIAEGSSRLSSPDKKKFYNHSYSSTIEVLSQLIISLEIGFISQEIYNELRQLIETISIKIAHLINAL